MNEEAFKNWMRKARWCTQEEYPHTFSPAAEARLHEMWEDGYSEDAAVLRLFNEDLL